MKNFFKRKTSRSRTGRAVFSLRDPSDLEKKIFFHAVNSALQSNPRIADHVRSIFFDLLVTKVENLLDASGNKITVDQKERIPLVWKASMVKMQFEGSQEAVPLDGAALAYPSQNQSHAVQLCQMFRNRFLAGGNER
jgi:hypothetical protein